jgi:uncharacterized small protein (DUF1192 family)
MDRITQKRRVLGYLQLNKSITPLTALSRLGVMRLGARIWDLRKEGHVIESRLIKNRGKHYARYSLFRRAP